MRRFRWILLLVVALVVVAVAAAFFLVRPGLEDSRDRVDARWSPLRPALIARYEALDAAAVALEASAAADRSFTTDLRDTLDDWDEYAVLGPAHTDPGAESALVNALEAQARRVKANIATSARLAQDEGLALAFAGFDQAVVDPAAVTSYNRAVRGYEDERSGFLESIVADALGYESRPVLIVGT